MNLIKACMIFLVVLLSALADTATYGVPTKHVKLAYIGDANHDAYLGAKQGFDEANLQGQFLGTEYTLTILDQDKTQNFSEFVALLVVLDDAALIKLSKRATDLPVFNLVSESDSLRKKCPANLLHTMPSTLMKQRAVTAAKEKYSRNLKAKAWHHDFNKYAARDLNKRFKKNAKRNMSEHAWSGWAAVKMATDSVARSSIKQGAELLKHLKHKLSFDGQKGFSMSFDNSGQLQQILLLTTDGELVGESAFSNSSGAAVPDEAGMPECENKITP